MATIWREQRGHNCGEEFGIERWPRRSQSFRIPEFSNYVRRIAMLAIYSFIHSAHVVFGDLAGESVQSDSDLGPTAKRVVAHQWDRLVRREVMAVILKHEK